MPVRSVFLLGWLFLSAASAVDTPEPQDPSIPPGASTAAIAPSADPLALLGAGEVQELLQWISRHVVDPAALSQENLNRAALRSLLADPRTGARLLAATGAAPAQPNPPLHATIGSAAYLRPGIFTPENFQALGAFFGSLPDECHTLILDLRQAQPPQPLAGAAEFVSLFLPPDLPLFLLTSQETARPVLFTSSASPVAAASSRKLWLLIDGQTSPAAELAGHLLVRHAAALCFGTPASGRITGTTDRSVGSGHLLRLPDATVSWPDGTPLTGTPLTPQIVIAPVPEARDRLLRLTDPAALPAFLEETDRPRFNEAALMAGSHPEITAIPWNAPPRPDPVLQQATDLLRISRSLKLDAPEEIKKATPGP